MVIWFATGRKSRKVKDMRHNPNVCVYFADHKNASGYVTINGKAEVIDDKELLVKMKRDYWESIPNWQDIFVLIKITPVTMDVTNYARGVAGDPETSRAPRVTFLNNEGIQRQGNALSLRFFYKRNIYYPCGFI